MGCTLALFAFWIHTAPAQTLVSGNISGTWTPAGNPYIATDNCTVPADTNLTIQPGVVVWIGENLSITVNGLIQAVGTPTQRITFQAPIESQYWSNIFCLYDSGMDRTYCFKYCDFRNAYTALSLRVYRGYRTMAVEIFNCTFSNCLSRAIYGEAEGWADWLDYEPATINPVIKNCVFNDTGMGCEIGIYGQWYYGDLVGYGYANPKIIGNIFVSLTDTAFYLNAGSYAGSSSALFLNNTVVNSWAGVDSREPWDANVRDNIFVGATNAVTTSGALSRLVGYNCFFGNATNFTGYPGTYGQWIIPNRNGTLSDILYNFSQNPLFVAINDFHLATNSPCIDAGTPDWAYTDMCFPPSQGNNYPDLGAYGGPDAANWLDVVPQLPATAWMSLSNQVVTLGWGAVPRSEYQVQYVTNLVVGTNDWLNFDNGHVLATEKPIALVIATNTSQAGQFFRIESLGRTPGN